MQENLDAIYENGAFHPLNEADISFSEGARVRLTVESMPETGGPNVLELAAKVYAGLSQDDVDAIERIAVDRTAFFSQ